MRNALKGMTEKEQMEAVGIDPGSRPEQIPLASWVRLANHLTTG
jgi:16S rRNA (adenine1518-N6/adenine1519-N6)-dimethyltransferase